MRKRLYQALPEDKELLESVNSAIKEKTNKRFYAKDSQIKDEIKSRGDTDQPEPLASYIALTAGNIDSMYASYKQYEKEIKRVPQAIYGNRCHFAATSAKFLDWYWRSGKVAWETGCAMAPHPYSWLK